MGEIVTISMQEAFTGARTLVCKAVILVVITSGAVIYAPEKQALWKENDGKEAMQCGEGEYCMAFLDKGLEM